MKGNRYELEPTEFKRFLDPSNLPAQLLLSYFVALQMLMVPLAVYEWPERADKTKSRVLSGTVEWALNIFKRLENAAKLPGKDQSWVKELARGMAWPKWIVSIVMREIGEERNERGERRLGGWDEDSLTGVSVLKLGLPISPSVEAEDSIGSEGDGILGGGDMPMGWNQGFWDDDSGPGMLIVDEIGMGGANPVHVTSMELDAIVAAQVPTSLSMNQANVDGLDAVDLEMDLM